MGLNDVTRAEIRYLCGFPFLLSPTAFLCGKDCLLYGKKPRDLVKYNARMLSAKNKERIIENPDAPEAELEEAEFRSLDEVPNQCKVYGHRGFSG